MKKRYLFLALTILAATVFTGGCGDNSNRDNSGDSTVVMVTGTEYEVFSGDRIVSSEADPARLSVRHVFDPEKKYVTLLEGSAELVVAK